MNTQNSSRFLRSLSLATTALVLAPSAFALEQITRPFQTTRTMSMGGTKITTGLYDENFYGNPARAIANPKWKLQILDIYAQANKSTFNTLNSLVGGGGAADVVSNLSSTAGEVNHVRLNTSIVNLHLPGEVWAMSFGLQSSIQADVDLRRSFQIDPLVVADVGAHATVARRLLEEKTLAVGATVHGAMRVSSKAGFSLVDFVQGNSLSPTSSGASGGGVDFDLGATYKLPFQPLGFDLETGATITNVLGGKMNQFKPSIGNAALDPIPQNRTYGLGVSARMGELWKFTDFVFAIEASDIGNNTNGSFWRTIHLGSEAKWGIIGLRAGINQGYLAGGVAFDLKILQLEAGTWGEEYSLNPGGYENRVYGVRLGLNI